MGTQKPIEDADDNTLVHERPVEIERAVPTPLSGWRLLGVLISLGLGFMLAIIETSITATALVTIGEYFHNSVTVTWVVLAYLLSYMGFAVIFTRLSDGIGRQPVVILAYVLFALFSLGGGLARTLNQLIALRVLQGVGGSGLYSMTFVVGFEVTPLQYWGPFSGMVGIVLAIGSVLGPVLGGVITEEATWRWIYLFNAPVAAVGIMLLIICWPRNQAPHKKPALSWRSLQKTDWIGALLLLAASTLLVFALQEAGSKAYSWHGPVIISTLTVSGVCWVAFFAWVSWLTHRKDPKLRPIFPIYLAITRPVGPTILLILLTGFPFFVTVINLPQRFQIVNQDSPIMAGVHLLPLLFFLAFGSFIGGAISSKKNLTSPTLIIAACLILLGCGLLSSLRTGTEFYKPTYGYEVILGLGIGLTFSCSTVLTNLASKPEDTAAAQGALSQMRMLGGSIGLAMATIILNRKLSNGLPGILDPARLENLEKSLDTLKTLDPEIQGLVAKLYADAFNKQMRICTYLSVGALLAAVGTWQRHPPSITELREKQAQAAGRRLDAESETDTKSRQDNAAEAPSSPETFTKTNHNS